MKSFGNKQPYEEFYLGFDFEGDLTDEDISTGVIVVTRLLDEKDVTTTFVDATKQQATGMILYFWVRTGRPNNKYQINGKIVGVNGAKHEFDATLKITQPKAEI